MKVVIVNKSGSVGKTTLTVHLIHPRMDNAPIYAIEATNTTAKDFNLPVKAYDPTQFREMLRDLFRDDDAILDIGGSKNFSDFYQKMIEAGMSHEEFDYFTIPVTPNEKAEKESIDTILALLEAGVSTKKIRVLFNRTTALAEFHVIPGAVAKFGLVTANVPDSEIYGILAGLGLPLPKLLADSTTREEYKALAIAEKKGSEKAEMYFNLYYAKSMSALVNEQLDSAWESLKLES